MIKVQIHEFSRISNKSIKENPAVSEVLILHLPRAPQASSFLPFSTMATIILESFHGWLLSKYLFDPLWNAAVALVKKEIIPFATNEIQGSDLLKYSVRIVRPVKIGERITNISFLFPINLTVEEFEEAQFSAIDIASNACTIGSLVDSDGYEVQKNFEDFPGLIWDAKNRLWRYFPHCMCELPIDNKAPKTYRMTKNVEVGLQSIAVVFCIPEGLTQQERTVVDRSAERMTLIIAQYLAQGRMNETGALWFRGFGDVELAWDSDMESWHFRLSGQVN